jgi:hypothetical protein
MMPHNPYWYRELPLIQRTLEAFAEPILDRQAIERLFRVSRPTAGRIMQAIGTNRAGNGNLVFRRQALAWIRKVARTADFAYDRRKVERIDAHLAEASAAIAARSIAVPAPRSEAFADLAPNIELTAGRLTITFDGAPELLRSLNEIVQAAARDWPRFQSACEN